MTEEVLFTKDTESGKEPVTPKRGRETDVAYDLYTAKDAFIFPSAIRSTLVPTGIHTAFDPEEWGLFISPRSSIMKTPLSLSNSTGIIEGEYRGDIGIPLRNNYTNDGFMPPTSNVVLTLDAEGRITKVPFTDFIREDDWKDSITPSYNTELLISLEQWLDEKKLLLDTDRGRDISTGNNYKEFDFSVPTGTFYLPKGTRIAQAYLLPRTDFKFVETDELQGSNRGSNGFGSSGVN